MTRHGRTPPRRPRPTAPAPPGRCRGSPRSEPSLAAARAEPAAAPRTPSSACTRRRPSRPQPRRSTPRARRPSRPASLAAADAPVEGDAKAAAKARAAGARRRRPHRRERPGRPRPPRRPTATELAARAAADRSSRSRRGGQWPRAILAATLDEDTNTQFLHVMVSEKPDQPFRIAVERADVRRRRAARRSATRPPARPCSTPAPKDGLAVSPADGRRGVRRRHRAAQGQGHRRRRGRRPVRDRAARPRPPPRPRPSASSAP